MSVSTTQEPRRLGTDDLIALVNEGHREPAWLDEAFYELASRPDARAYFADQLRRLIDGAEHRDVDWLSAFVLGLTAVRPVPRGTYQLLYELVEDERPSLVASALDALAHTAQRERWPVLLRLANHDAPEVRGAWLRYVTRVTPSRAWGFLVSALRDEHPLVRENAIDELHETGGDLALPVLADALNDADPKVRQAAKYAVDDLSSGRQRAQRA